MADVVEVPVVDKNGRAIISVLSDGSVVMAANVRGGRGVGVGYAAAGGAVAQLTDRSTGVTVNALSGAITTHDASLAAEGSAEFTVTDSAVEIGDTVVVSIRSGANGGNTAVTVSAVAAGSFKLRVSNNNAAGGTAETGALILNFAVVKAVSA